MGALSGRTAIVTGSARNIGRATVLALARAGANVVVHARSDKEGCAETLALVEQAGGKAIAHLADLTREDGAAGLAQAALDAFGGIGILVNNAAMRRNTPFTELSLEEWHTVLRNNLDCAFLAARACVPHMLARNWGRIVNVGGMSAHRGVAERAHVAAAKTGVIGLTKSLATEFARNGITVNCVVPGMVDTVRGAAASKRPADEVSHGNLVGREGTPEEIAFAIAMLCQPQAGYMTGQILHANGGGYLP